MRATLVRIASNTDPAYVNDGELIPAAAALRRGDTAPLMRIAANNTSPLFGDSGDPATGSTGLNAAAQCTDLTVPWDLSAPFARRRAQFEAAIQRISFGPFSPDAFANKAGFSNYCLRWPAPRHVIPVFTPRTRFPDVPVLIIAATLDTSTTLEQNKSVARRFPHAQLVVLRNGGHPPGVFASCVPDIYARFLRTLKAGDTSCVRRDDPDRPAVGVFARRLADAPLAAPTLGDQSSNAQRRLATVVWMTAQDALRQSFRFPDMSHAAGVGLRGGRFTETFDFDKERAAARPAPTALQRRRRSRRTHQGRRRQGHRHRPRVGDWPTRRRRRSRDQRPLVRLPDRRRTNQPARTSRWAPRRA